MWIASVYENWGDDEFNPNQYDDYMSLMDEWSKFEVEFKCVKDGTPEPTPEPVITVEENNGVFTVTMADNSNRSVSFSRNLSCESGIVQRKIVSISGLGEEYCDLVANYVQFVYRNIVQNNQPLLDGNKLLLITKSWKPIDRNRI